MLQGSWASTHTCDNYQCTLVYMKPQIIIHSLSVFKCLWLWGVTKDEYSHAVRNSGHGNHNSTSTAQNSQPFVQIFTGQAKARQV